MTALNLPRRLAVLALAALAWAAIPAAYAHHAGPSGHRSAAAGVPDGTPMSLEGRLSILDFVYPGGAGHERIYALVGNDGAVTRLSFAANAGVHQGASLVVSGYVSRGALAVQMPQGVPRKSIAAVAKPTSVEGTLNLLHADNFDGGTSRFVWTVDQDDGQSSELDIPIAPTDMKPGMRVVVTGTSSGTTITPDSIAALTQAPDAIAAATTSSLLVILLNFQPTPPAVAPSQPFTQAAVNAVVFSGAGSIAAYWSEVSFGNQLLTGTVTPWLTASFQTPTTCDYSGIATEAKRVALLAGYNPASYQKVHYLFTRVGACGWAGLGQVPGSQSWSNQYNSLGVIGHELGHNLGLGHANSLPCNGATIGTSCPLSRPEYGDPWDIMGNVSTRSVNAWQKNDMGWVPDAKVATHPGGTASYTLSPLTSPGGTLYAVQVPAAVHRTYWIEFRQATGFDAGLPASATNGAIIHLAGLMHQADRSEYGCWDTCFLDMVPSTSTMTDGALQVPSAFVDAQTGVTISAVSKGAGGLTVTVASPPTRINTGLYRKLSSTGAPLYRFLLDYGFAQPPDAKIPFGTAGDVPLVGTFTSDGLTSLVIYRSGLWYLDTNRDGAVNKTVALGGAPGDIPLAANFTGSGSMDDLVIYRSGAWYVDQSFNGSVNKTFRFGGVPGDIPLAGDVNGDGIADLVIYRNGAWYIDTNRDGAVDMTVHFGGMPQDIPVLFDYDGDGKADLCIFRDGIWYVNTKRDGTMQAMFSFGAPGDIPLTGHFY
jgi:Gametolysin peptidase M11